MCLKTASQLLAFAIAVLPTRGDLTRTQVEVREI